MQNRTKTINFLYGKFILNHFSAVSLFSSSPLSNTHKKAQLFSILLPYYFGLGASGMIYNDLPKIKKAQKYCADVPIATLVEFIKSRMRLSHAMGKTEDTK